MAKRNYKPEEIVSKLRQADVLISQGSKIPDVVRKAVSDLTLDKLILAEAASRATTAGDASTVA